MDKLYAPWTDEQVDALNAYQHSGLAHPFTCRDRGDGHHKYHDGDFDIGTLVATPAGWVCNDCPYAQNWAHAPMADELALRRLRKSLEEDYGFKVE